VTHPRARTAASIIILLASAWALLATSEARFEVRHRLTGEPITLGPGAAHRRINVALNAPAVRAARVHGGRVSFAADASITATLPGTPRPASVRVRFEPVDRANPPVTSPDGRSAHVYTRIDCSHRACVQAFDLYFEWIGPPAATPAQVEWTVASEASVYGEMNAPPGAALTSEIAL
jgi:hypothetical protein